MSSLIGLVNFKMSALIFRLQGIRLKVTLAPSLWLRSTPLA